MPLLDLMQTHKPRHATGCDVFKDESFHDAMFFDNVLVGTATCLGQRDSQSPMKIFAFAGGLNLVLDLYLVIGPPKMGIAGAAIATAFSQTCAAAIFMRKLEKSQFDVSDAHESAFETIHYRWWRIIREIGVHYVIL